MDSAGYLFEIMTPDSSVEQSVCKSLPPVDFVMEASRRKADAIARQVNESAILIAADTVAECQGQILGNRWIVRMLGECWCS